MKNIVKKNTALLSIILGFLGLGLFMYMWKTIGDGGIYADEHGTSGYIPIWQIIAFLVSICLIILSLIMFVGRKK
jgi:hypothetical protein